MQPAAPPAQLQLYPPFLQPRWPELPCSLVISALAQTQDGQSSIACKKIGFGPRPHQLCVRRVGFSVNPEDPDSQIAWNILIVRSCRGCLMYQLCRLCNPDASL